MTYMLELMVDQQAACLKIPIPNLFISFKNIFLFWSNFAVHRAHIQQWYTANVYSQFTVNGCITCATVIWQCLLQPKTVHMTFNDIEEYSMRSIAILGCNVYSQITVAHVTLPKAVLNTVKIFAVYDKPPT